MESYLELERGWLACLGDCASLVNLNISFTNGGLDMGYSGTKFLLLGISSLYNLKHLSVSIKSKLVRESDMNCLGDLSQLENLNISFEEMHNSDFETEPTNFLLTRYEFLSQLVYLKNLTISLSESEDDDFEDDDFEDFSDFFPSIELDEKTRFWNCLSKESLESISLNSVFHTTSNFRSFLYFLNTFPKLNSITLLNPNKRHISYDSEFVSVPAFVSSLNYLKLGGFQSKAINSCFPVISKVSCLNIKSNLSLERNNFPATTFLETMTTLDCSDNSLKSLFFLPSTLQNLNCSNNCLKRINFLPFSLIDLDCSSNSIVSIFRLPATLKNFMCKGNWLIKLPTLPSSLRILDCSNNRICSLPILPDLLVHLKASHNKIQEIVSVPEFIKVIIISDNPLKKVPYLPKSLMEVSLKNCLSTLEELPIVNDNFLDCIKSELFDLSMARFKTAYSMNKTFLYSVKLVIPTLQLLSRHIHLEATVQLGLCYLDGILCEKSLDLSFHYLKQASKMSSTSSKSLDLSSKLEKLGLSFENGVGVTVDYIKAGECYDFGKSCQAERFSYCGYRLGLFY